MSALEEFLKSKGFVINFPVFILEGGLKLKMPAFLLRGPPGVGKTELTRLVAEFLGAKYIFYQCTLNTSEDDLLYRYIPDEKTKSGIKVLPSVLPQALELSKTEKVVVVLDEFDKTRPSADALLLDFLQNARVSARFESKKEIIGNPENIIVFLTSNDMREFSEPLLRRVIQLRLEPLPSKEVANILRTEGFSKELVKLLVQIYEDTQNAGLRKPATIQELKQLGHIIEQNPNADLDTLITSIIIKYDEDLEVYKEYLLTKRDFEVAEKEKDYFITNHYLNIAKEQEKQNENAERTKQDQQAPQVNQILELLKVKQPFAEITPSPASEKEETVYMKAKDEERQAYTEIIKSLKPEPSDTPEKFGKFEVKLENNIPYVISKEPLTYEELASNVEGEGYAKFNVVFNKDYMFRVLIDNAEKVKYYTKNVLAIQATKNSTKILIKYDSDKNELETYYNGKSRDAFEFFMNNVIGRYDERYFYKDYSTRCPHKDEFQNIINWVKELAKIILPEAPVVTVSYHDADFRIRVTMTNVKILIAEECPLMQSFKEIRTFGELAEKIKDIIGVAKQ